MSDDALQILGRETAYQGFFRVDRYRLRHRRYDGGWSGEINREILERGNAVGILLYDPGRDAVVLVEQFRLAAHLAGCGAWQTEIVAGLVDRTGESEAQVALREAREEAGLTVLGELLLVHRFLTSPGAITETVAVFCGRVDASDAGGIHGLAAEHEDIKVMVMSADEAIGRARAGKIDNGVTLIALYWLAGNREMLRQRWR
jgi:ADP-ribose pyrophosphatase